MKTSKLRLFTFSLACVTFLTEAQGSFQNLDFESATIVPVSGFPFDVVEFDPAFPGWTGYLGTEQQTLALHNQFFSGSAVLGIMEQLGAPIPVIEGNYMAVLQPGVGGPTGTNELSAAIAQTSLIPVDSNSLLFKSDSYLPNLFEVTIGGQTIPVIPLAFTGNYFLLGGNISPFAGQTKELRITALYGLPSFSVDSIEFSGQVVPEPSTLGLFALGGLLLGRRSRRISRER